MRVDVGDVGGGDARVAERRGQAGREAKALVGRVMSVEGGERRAVRVEGVGGFERVVSGGWRVVEGGGRVAEVPRGGVW